MAVDERPIARRTVKFMLNEECPDLNISIISLDSIGLKCSTPGRLMIDWLREPGKVVQDGDHGHLVATGQKPTRSRHSPLSAARPHESWPEATTRPHGN
jgi:hypothetical protein